MGPWTSDSECRFDINDEPVPVLRIGRPSRRNPVACCTADGLLLVVSVREGGLLAPRVITGGGVQVATNGKRIEIVGKWSWIAVGRVLAVARKPQESVLGCHTPTERPAHRVLYGFGGLKYVSEVTSKGGALCLPDGSVWPCDEARGSIVPGRGMSQLWEGQLHCLPGVGWAVLAEPDCVRFPNGSCVGPRTEEEGKVGGEMELFRQKMHRNKLTQAY